MSQSEIHAGDDIDFIEDEIRKTATKTAHTRKGVTTKKIRVRSSVEKSRDDYKRAKKLHKQQIKLLRSNIKKHKLLMNQARTQYKLVKLANKG